MTEAAGALGLGVGLLTTVAGNWDGLGAMMVTNGALSNTGRVQLAINKKIAHPTKGSKARQILLAMRDSGWIGWISLKLNPDAWFVN